ncbi:L,D-transpeptidase [Methylobacterium sp. A54F]
MVMRNVAVRAGLVGLLAAGLAGPAQAAKEKAEAASSISLDAVNAARFAPEDDKTKGADKGADKAKPARARRDDDRPDALTIKVQVLLDRARFSPGAIDGRDGDNVQGALSAFAVAQGLPAGKSLTAELFDKLQATSQDPVVATYTVTDADVAGPFVEKMPAKMEGQADLDALGYTNVREMLAERFHMSRDLLSALNPDAALDKPGTVLTVAAVPPLEMGKVKARDLPRQPKVTRIEVDKSSRDVRAFGSDGRLLAYYPASIGSEEKPAPSGEAKVKGVAFDPHYTYNPKYKFAGVKANRKFSIKPGPNNPVGVVWIDLSIPSYGIHGTPEPEKVSKTESHGCIRLTNWDARDLALHVERGAKVAFKDE